MESQLHSDFISFSRKLFLLGGKYYERNTAKKNLLEHIDKVKKLSTGKRDKLLKELDILDAKISDLIEKEKKIAGSHAASYGEITELRNKAAMLERQLWKEMASKEQIIEKNMKQAQELRNAMNKIREELNSLKKVRKKK